MKKLLLTLVTFVGLTLQSQAQFFEKVDYAGALSSELSKDWTKGWTEWNPKTSIYADVTDTTTFCSSTGKVEITGTLVLDASKVYLLKSLVVVKMGGRLIVPAGTSIRALADATSTPKQYATIVIERGGWIAVNGTSSSPVVFTSAKAVGSRDRGDWGGLVLCGNAVNNQGPNIQMEGFNNIALDNALAKHGGTNDADNSCNINYLRIEFGGYAFEPNKEINGLTMASVGNGSLIDHVQVSYSGDDSYEWFGGTVNCKHIIAYKGTDDDFDTDFGYRGGVQFGIGYKDSAYFDLSWNSTGGSTSEGFESDNDASGSGRLPLTAAIFSNMTMVGPVPVGMSWSQLSTTSKGAFRRGVRIRRNSRLSIINSIFMGYRNFIMFDGDSVLTNSGVKSKTISDKNDLFRYNYIYSVKSSAPKGATNTGLAEISAGGNVLLLDSWIRNSYNANTIDTNVGTYPPLINTTTQLNFRPTHPFLTSYLFEILNPFGVYSKVFIVKKQSSIAYPNPTNEGINIRPCSYRLVNSNGAVVAEGNNSYIDTKNFSNGVYYLMTSNGVETIIVQH